MHRYADGSQIPWVVFRKGVRKLEVIRPYLDAAERAGRSEVVAIGEAREFQWVFDATMKDGPDGVPWFRFYRTERLVTCYYFYINDRRVAPAFIKVCCYAPYPVKVGLLTEQRDVTAAQKTELPWRCVTTLTEMSRSACLSGRDLDLGTTESGHTAPNGSPASSSLLLVSANPTRP